MKSLKAIFDYHFKDTRFDKRFKENVFNFVRRFLSKNDDHVQFFGGHLLGVHAIRWNYSDSDYWWDDIFEVIPEYIQQDILKIPAVKANRVVSSDVLNHAFIYSLHRVHHSRDLNDAEKAQLKLYLMLAMNMKFICSLAAHYFKYPADRGIAEKTYNSLTKRFDLKEEGSWGKMLQKRSRDYVADTGNYYKAYVEYTDDFMIVKMINDAQGRIRETYKAITAKYYEMLHKDAKVLSSSANVNLDGVVVLKDVMRKTTQYNRYIKSVISSKDSFIKEPLTQVIYRAVPSLQEDIFEKLLNTMSEHYHDKKYTKHFDTLIDSILTFSFDLIKDNEIADNDLPGVLYRCKHVYMSGRVQDPQLDKAKDCFIKVVEAMDKSLVKTPMIPERCGIFLYIVLRTLTMNYFK